MAAKPPIDTSVSLQGWDTANAARFPAVNAAIVAQGSTPDSFAFTAAPLAGGMTIEGAWDSWQLVPGSAGETLIASLPIKSGLAANPAEIDPTYTAPAGKTLVFSNGNLTVGQPAGATANVTCFANTGKTSGKYYFEATNNSATGMRDLVFVGVSPKVPNANPNFGTLDHGYAYASDGDITNNGVRKTTSADWDALGATVGIAIDLDNRKIWFRDSAGNWIGTGADPATGAGQVYALDPTTTFFPAITLQISAAVTLNFGATPFKFAVPSGFAARYLDDGTTLDGAFATAKILLAKVPGTAGEVQLVPDTSGTPATPAAEVPAVTMADGSAAPSPVVQAFDGWLKAHIGDFTNIFHTIDISAAAAKDGYAWMKPTGFTYAAVDRDSVDATGAPQTSSILAILGMTEGRTSSTLAAQVPPNILAHMPATADMVLAMSEERLLEKMLLSGALMLVKGSTEADFTVGMGVVSNNKAMPWRQLTLEDGSVVTPEIPIGGLRISIDGKRIKFSFNGLSFVYPGAVLIGTDTVTYSFDQSLYLKLAKRKDGRHVIVPSFADPDDPTSKDEVTIENLVITNQLNKTAKDAQTAMLVAGIVLSVLTIGLVAGTGFLIKSGTAAAAEAQSTANNVQMTGVGVGNYGILPVVSNPLVYDAVDSPLEAAASASTVYDVVPGGVYGPFPAAASTLLPKYAIAAGVGSFIFGAATVTDWTLWAVKQTDNPISVDNIDKLDLRATVETFLAEILDRYAWPETTGFDLVDIRLDGSLMFYCKLK